MQEAGRWYKLWNLILHVKLFFKCTEIKSQTKSSGKKKDVKQGHDYLKTSLRLENKHKKDDSLEMLQRSGGTQTELLG